jgi:16S rRNA (guanine966-N2)-methyltransferase
MLLERGRDASQLRFGFIDIAQLQPADRSGEEMSFRRFKRSHIRVKTKIKVPPREGERLAGICKPGPVTGATNYALGIVPISPVVKPSRVAYIVFMRITGGKAARTLLKVPRGFDVRPTPDLVKQALFNSLGARVAGTHVLELFAGTGALAIECLSRGAVSALCIEKSARHAAMLRQNSESAGFGGEVLQVRAQDAFTALRQLADTGIRFELILADPPYGEKNVSVRSNSLAQKLLDDTRLPRILAEGGVFVLGHARRDTLSIPGSWRELKMLKHGDSIMRFLSVQADTL